MAILSLVGKLKNMVGIAGRMFTSLAQGNVNLEMISQGASEVNISCVIQGRDAVKALNLIHQSCLQIKVEERRGRGEQNPISVLIGRLANRSASRSWAMAILSELPGPRFMIPPSMRWFRDGVLHHRHRHHFLLLEHQKSSGGLKACEG